MSTRTAFVCTADGCAMATVRRAAAGGRELVSCHSVDAGREEQKAVIAGWLSSERGDLGAVSSVLDGYDYQLLLVESPDVLPAELRAAVRWRLKDNTDFPVEDAVVDVFDIPEQTRRVGSKNDVHHRRKTASDRTSGLALQTGGTQFRRHRHP